MRPIIPTPTLVLVVTESPIYGHGKTRLHFTNLCPRLDPSAMTHTQSEMMSKEWVATVLNNRDMDMCGDCLANRL